jgi:cytochrome c peroxidase
MAHRGPLVVSLLLLFSTVELGGHAAAAAPPARPTASGRYAVSLRPVAAPVRMNEWQEWAIRVTRRDGAPLVLRAVALDGGMPGHGHGLPTAPEVVAAGSTGDFIARGVRFHMAGRWELRVLLADGDGADAATFAIDVAPAASAAAARPAASTGARWSEAERATLRSLSIQNLGPPPADRSNRVADDPRAAAFGHRLFFDAGLSGDGRRSCASCHQPRRHFVDRLAVGRGAALLDRNTPTVVGVAYARWLYWDGRRDSSWSQALAPIESPAEMAGARAGAVLRIAGRPDHRAEYEALFGPLPDLAGVPARASPAGDASARAAWRRLSPTRQQAIDRAFANLGKAIAAYERRLLPGPSAFDRYVEALERGDDEAAARLLDPRALAGLAVFISDDAQCLRCHNGPLFTNGEFHNIGTGIPARRGARPDFGRSIGIQALLASEFNCLGPYSDDPDRTCRELRFLDSHEQNGSLVGAYKVPSLRGVALTAPYMHDGRFATLTDAIGHYRRPAPSPAPIEFRPLFDMTPERVDALVAFLESLSAPVAAPPDLLRPPPQGSGGRKATSAPVVPASTVRSSIQAISVSMRFATTMDQITSPASPSTARRPF